MQNKQEVDLTVGTYIVRDGKVLLILHRKLDKWLPPGGHIDKNETPDQAAIREVKEETSLEVELLDAPEREKVGDVVEYLARPFHVNRHNVGDHDHVCFYYAAKVVGGELDIREEEVKDAKWFELDELGKVPEDVKFQAEEAVELSEI